MQHPLTPEFTAAAVSFYLASGGIIRRIPNNCAAFKPLRISPATRRCIAAFQAYRRASGRYSEAGTLAALRAIAAEAKPRKPHASGTAPERFRPAIADAPLAAFGIV